MASTEFRLKLASTSGVPPEPPIDAWPVSFGSNVIAAPPTVRYVTPTDVDGVGRPAGIIGRPWTEFGRDRISAVGYAWYNAFFDSSQNYVEVKVKLYDERALGWTIWRGWMWRPTHDGSLMAGPGGPFFVNFRVKITNLVPSAW